MKNYSPAELVNEVRAEIERIAPSNSEIDVLITEDPVGHFSTNLKIQTRTHTYFVKKEDDYLYKSLTKALRALKAQLGKKRFNHVHQTVSLRNVNIFSRGP